MARHKLTDAECRHAATDAQDGRGLFLRVIGGSKTWGYRYQLRSKRTTLGLGPYPAVSLAAARQRHREAESLVKQSITLKTTGRYRNGAESLSGLLLTST